MAVGLRTEKGACLGSELLPKFGPVVILFRAFLLPIVSFAENVQENIDVYP